MQAVRRSCRRSRLRSLLGGFVVGMCGFAIPAGTASAQESEGDPWPCDNVPYLTQFDDSGGTGGDTLFHRLEQQADGSFARVQLGQLNGAHLNAMGFRAQDGYMYAFNNTADEIMRIGLNAAGEPVHVDRTATRLARYAHRGRRGARGRQLPCLGQWPRRPRRRGALRCQR